MQNDTWIGNNQLQNPANEDLSYHNRTEPSVNGKGNTTPRRHENHSTTQQNVNTQQTSRVLPSDLVLPDETNVNGRRRRNQQQRQDDYDHLKRRREDFMKNEAYQKLLPYLHDVFIGNHHISEILDKRLRTKVYNMNGNGFRDQFDCLKDVYQSCPDVSQEYLLDVLNCSHNRHDYVFISSRASESHEWQVFEMELIDTLRMIIKDDMAKR